MAFFPRPVTRMMLSTPDATASSTPYWMMGLSTSGSTSLGCALVAGSNRVPRPAAGNTAFRPTVPTTGLYNQSAASCQLAAQGPASARPRRHRQMIDPIFIRDHVEEVRVGLRNRGL